MKEQCIESLGRISAKPGDILLTRSKSCGSLLIRIATFSMWSHVGIIVDDESVLEAVKVRRTTDGMSRQVRVVSIECFAANASKTRHYIRPENLTANQIEKLKSFVNSKNEARYTALHAALTAFIPIMKLCFVVAAIIATRGFWAKTESFAGQNMPFWLGVLTVYGIIYLMYRLMAWSFRSELGVKATENIFNRIRLGRWLVGIKYEMFCSKLVMLAEREIGGSLASYFPSEDEIQPKHIAKACKEFGWLAVDV